MQPTRWNLFLLLLSLAGTALAQDTGLTLNEQEYFETRGLNVLVFNNWYSGLFSDSKLSSVEIIHHGVRTATNGDVRLSNTPEQWDPVPTFTDRQVDAEGNRIEALLGYPDYDFTYRIGAESSSRTCPSCRKNGLSSGSNTSSPRARRSSSSATPFMT